MLDELDRPSPRCDLALLALFKDREQLREAGLPEWVKSPKTVSC